MSTDDERELFIPAAPKQRATHMQITDLRMLDDWGQQLRLMFPGEVAYHVGSSLKRPDYRDVDVRIIMIDKKYAKLAKLVQINRLNVCLSLWGHRVTGLPIDCQVQQMTEANDEYKPVEGHSRSALGISDWGRP